MSGLDALFHDLASNMIGEYGTAASLVHTVMGTYDPATGGSTDVDNTYPCQAVLDATATKRLGFMFGDGLVLGGDQLATIPAKGLAVTPQAGDSLILDTVYSIVEVRPTYSGGVTVMYECLVRR